MMQNARCEADAFLLRSLNTAQGLRLDLFSFILE